jgi:NTE family protein
MDEAIPPIPCGDRGRIGLCLSGGGYRAMLFHTGALWRLNELGWLPRLDVVSSVSGGSIAAGVLAHGWAELDFTDGVAGNFREVVVAPLRRLASRNLDIPVTLRGLLKPWRSVGEELAGSYRRHLFGEFTLRDLPKTPRFVFTATNLQNGALWRFSRAYMCDYRVGGVSSPPVPLAFAVAASSAFPPFLSPLRLPVAAGEWNLPGEHEGERAEDVILSDGGVYDNLGLQPVEDRCEIMLASDAGLRMKRPPKIPGDWPRHLLRVLDVIDNQVRSLRKRSLLKSYVDGERRGTYWGSYSDIDHFELPDALPAPVEQTLRLAEIPTRLGRIADLPQQRLINWGYAVCDAGMRRWVDPAKPAPQGFPYPAAAVGEPSPRRHGRPVTAPVTGSATTASATPDRARGTTR